MNDQIISATIYTLTVVFVPTIIASALVYAILYFVSRIRDLPEITEDSFDTDKLIK